MEKFFREYGVIIILYLLIIIGVYALNYRMHSLNVSSKTDVSITQKTFTK